VSNLRASRRHFRVGEGIGRQLAWASRMRSLRSAAAILITFIVVTYLFAAMTRTWRRFWLLRFPVCLLGAVFVIYTVTFGMPPGSTLASILAFASIEEVSGFAGIPQGQAFFLVLGAWSICYLACASVASSCPIFAGRGVFLHRVVMVPLVPVAAHAASNPSQLIDGIVLAKKARGCS
jgi:hypothetical protein